MHMVAYVWKSGDRFGELILSFYGMVSEDQTQVTGLGSKCPYPSRHLVCPQANTLMRKYYIDEVTCLELHTGYSNQRTQIHVASLQSMLPTTFDLDLAQDTAPAHTSLGSDLTIADHGRKGSNQLQQDGSPHCRLGCSWAPCIPLGPNNNIVI